MKLSQCAHVLCKPSNKKGSPMVFALYQGCCTPFQDFKDKDKTKESSYQKISLTASKCKTSSARNAESLSCYNIRYSVAENPHKYFATEIRKDIRRL